MPTKAKTQAIKSFMAWCLPDLAAACLPTKAREPQWHWCGTHSGKPSLVLASSLSLGQQGAIGKAKVQSPRWRHDDYYFAKIKATLLQKMQDIGRVCIEVVHDVSHWTATALKHQIQQWDSDQCRQYVPCSCYSHWNVLLPIAVCCVNS